MDLFRLDGKTAFVTGAGSGIGQGIAIGLAEAGADVACFGRSEAGLADTADRIAALGRKARVRPGDVPDAARLAAAVAQTERDLGPLDLAVNSAGVAGAAPAEAMALTDFQRIIDINLTG